MTAITRLAVGVLGCAGAVLSVTHSSGAAAPIDAAAIRQTAGPAVCRVTVENTWGIPVAYASGFLLGDGRFVVTDLGAVARPGVGQALLRFDSGPAAVVKQFGMADPALGLVLLRVEGEGLGRPGLPLGTALPPTDGTVMVAEAGWRWGEQLEVATGRLLRGPLIKEAAALARIETPSGHPARPDSPAEPGPDAFLRMEGGRLEGAPGSPVVDTDGTVIGVAFDVVLRDTVAPLAVPATSLRGALLSAQPQLKPIQELPKPLWPSRPVRVPGAVVTSAEFAKLVAAAKAGLVCPTCKGKGQVTAQDFGAGEWAGRWADHSFTCPTCRGEKTGVAKDGMNALAEMLERATCTAWGATGDDRTRAAVRAACADVMKGLLNGSTRFVHDYAGAVSDDLAKVSGRPRGLAIRAEVAEALDGPDGRYLVLAPYRATTKVAVRIDDLLTLGGKAPMAGRKEPLKGSWVMVAGTALSRFKTEQRDGVFLLPVEWMAATEPVKWTPPADPGWGRGGDRGGWGGGGPGGGGPGGPGRG